MSRFVIRNASGMFYTGNDVPETVYVPIPGNPSVAEPVSKLAPRFDAGLPGAALKYDTAEDARLMCAHSDLVDSQAFSGCEVVEE